MPASTAKRAAQGGRRRRVAEALVAGKDLAEVAKSEQVSGKTIQRVANEGDTKCLIARLVAAHELEFEAMFADSVLALGAAVKATIPSYNKATKAWEEYPDHVVRLAGIQRLTQLLLAASKTADPDSTQRPGWTWEEFCQLHYRETVLTMRTARR